MLTNRTTTLVAVATTAFTFACVGVFLLLYVNLKSMASSLERDIQVLVYLEDGLGPGATALLEQFDRGHCLPTINELICLLDAVHRSVTGSLGPEPGQTPRLAALRQ